MNRWPFYLATAVTGAIALPLLVLIASPSLIVSGYSDADRPLPPLAVPTSYSEVDYSKFVAPRPRLGQNVIQLVEGLFAVGDYKTLDSVIQKIPQPQREPTLIYGINTEVNRLFPPQYSSDGRMPPQNQNEVVNGLLQYVKTIEYPAVRVRAFLDIAPHATDSNSVLKNSIESLDSLPSAWQEQSQATPHASLQAYSDSFPTPDSNFPVTPSNTQQTRGLAWWLASLGGLLGVAVAFALTKMVEAPLQNLGKATASYILDSNGFKAAAGVIGDGQIPKSNSTEENQAK